MNSKQSGLTLIELMVSMLLGLFLVTTTSQVFLSSHETARLNHQLGLMQESARIAMTMISRDVRMAGYTGCDRSTPIANTLRPLDSSQQWIASSFPVQGLPHSVTMSNFDSAATSEGIIIFKLTPDEIYPIDSITKTATSSTLSLVSYVSFPTHLSIGGFGLGMVRQDCSQVTLASPSAFPIHNNEMVFYTTPAHSSNYLFENCYSELQGDFQCFNSTPPTGSINFNPGFVTLLSSVAYYIRTVSGLPTLAMISLYEVRDNNNLTATSVVDGIEQFRIYYGLDSDGDGSANRYIRASDLAFQSADWDNITSLRVHLIARSEIEVTGSPRDYFFDGSLVTPTDNFLRKEYISTMALRN